MTAMYPYLPEGRKILYVLETDPFMIAAKKARAELSTDSGHPTGAVIVLSGVVVGRGANQSTLKNRTLHEMHRRWFCLRRFLKIPSGTKYWLCPGCASSASHAEPRAVRDALSRQSSISGADLYLYGHWWCCKPCWNSMIVAGIKNVYLVEGAREKFSR